ncbi:nucleotidyltransferase family protein [Methanoregula sp.]|uniref:nucleotidyltransferase family protein n=1 Tax=Methanoregula sp. TaxID=2052170 RepID=UPI00356AD0E7
MDSENDISLLLIRKKQEILRLAQQRGARNIRVFGSVARNEARADSDIDLLIDLDPGRSLLDVGGLSMDLSRLLDRSVDVVTEAGLRGRIRSRVLSEARAL